MELEYLDVYRFRNLLPQRISFTKRVTLVHGKNGQGKTSLIEAVYILAHAKSFRSNKTKELVSWTPAASSNAEADCFVEGRVRTSSGSKTIRWSMVRGKRSVFLNGNKLEAASTFYGQLNCVVFTPDDLVLVKGSPSYRRSFLDRLLAMSDSRYVDSLVAYQRALKNRNKLLSSRKEAPLSYVTIKPWDQLLIQHGREIAKKRAELIEELRPLANTYHQSLVSSGDEEVHYQYQSQFIANNAEPYGHEELESRFEESLQKDGTRQGTSIGIHRDEVLIELLTPHGNKNTRQGASQGQARSIALSLKLAAIEVLRKRTDELPILLLDDVESELDASRKQAFFTLLNSFQTQVIISSTGLSSELREAIGELDLIEISEGALRA